MNKSTILQALSWRYAGKIFDTTKKVSDEDLNTILESGRLSPSVYGIEPWQFIIINNKDLRTKLREASYGQPKVTDASHIIVIATKTNKDEVIDDHVKRSALSQGKTVEDLKGFADMLHGAANSKGADVISWFKSQTYIALGMMVETAALLGVDSGPMEGFDADKVNEILDLPSKGLHATTMLALGYRGEDDYAKLPKVRREHKEVVTVID